MPRINDFAEDALYLAWKVGRTGPEPIREALRRGERGQLFRLRAHHVAGEQAQVLLTPQAPLEEIVEALWVGDSEPTAGRWVRRGAACAELTRQMKTAPIR